MGNARPKRDVIAYVPIRPRGVSDTQIYVELLPLKDGGKALLAYTSMEELVRCWGPKQPWGGLDERGLDELKAATGYRVMLLDQEIPLELRRPAASRQPEPVVEEQDEDWGMPDSWLEPVWDYDKKRRR
jgi:hypothetical protein